MSGENGSGVIFSIGQGQRDAADMAKLLREHGIQFLLDVRSKPYSGHNPQYSREPLAVLLHSVGVRYGFLGDQLGGRPADRRCYSPDGRVDYDKCRESDFFKRGIERLRSALRQGFRVCLFCSEGRPTECHRSKLIGATLAADGIPLSHILPSGAVTTQDEVMRELTGGQAVMFDAGVPRGLRSRKIYAPAASERFSLENPHPSGESFTLEGAAEPF